MTETTLRAEEAQDLAGYEGELPPLWRKRHGLLATYMRGTGRQQAGLRRHGKAPICYVLAGWFIEDWKRAYRKKAELRDVVSTIGIKPSQAQNLMDQALGFLAPGGIWNSRKKGAAISGKPAHRGTNPKAAVGRADDDFLHDFWRSGGVEAIDLHATSVVDHNAHYIEIGRKLPPVHIHYTRGKATRAAPPSGFEELGPLHQVVIAYGALVRKWEDIICDGLEGAAYRLTGKMHARTEAVIRSKSKPPAYVRKRCLDEIEKERVRCGAPKFTYDLMIIIERDERGQWHIHGAAGGPVLYKEIIEDGIDRALGRWRHDGSSQRGYKPVLLERGVTTRGITYGANKPACYVAAEVQVAITRGLVCEAKDFYRKAVADVLEYRRTGGKRLSLHAQVLAPAGTYETDLMRRRTPLIWECLEAAARSRGKTLSRLMGTTAAAVVNAESSATRH